MENPEQNSELGKESNNHSMINVYKLQRTSQEIQMLKVTEEDNILSECEKRRMKLM